MTHRIFRQTTFAIALGIASHTSSAWAQGQAPEPSSSTHAPDLAVLPATEAHGESTAHAAGLERWRANFQSTYLWQDHPGFSAPYDGPNSLVHAAETGYTLTATLYFGVQLWRRGGAVTKRGHAEAIFDGIRQVLGRFSRQAHLLRAGRRDL